jgi:hypothetical protein
MGIAEVGRCTGLPGEYRVGRKLGAAVKGDATTGSLAPVHYSDTDSR